MLKEKVPINPVYVGKACQVQADDQKGSCTEKKAVFQPVTVQSPEPGSEFYQNDGAVENSGIGLEDKGDRG